MVMIVLTVISNTLQVASNSIGSGVGMRRLCQHNFLQEISYRRGTNSDSFNLIRLRIKVLYIITHH